MSFGEGNLRTAVAELQARIDELEHENAILKARIDTFAATAEGTHVVLDFWKDGDVCHVVTTDGEEIYDYQKWLTEGRETVYEKSSELQAENEQLKQLVRDMYSDFQRIIEGGRKLEYEQRMNELGIEVEQ